MSLTASAEPFSFNSAQSNNINKARMRLLVARQEMLDVLFADARKELVEIAKDATRYKKFLEDGLVQVGLATHRGVFSKTGRLTVFNNNI